MASAPPSAAAPARTDRGFTLIELLVVIIIIGILSAIAIPTYMHQRTKAEVATLRADMTLVTKTMESWYADGNINSDAYDIQSTGYSAGYVYLSSGGDTTLWPHRATEERMPSLDSTKVSRGTGIGVHVYFGQRDRGYCILGVRRKTPYNYGTDGGGGGAANHHRFLFWDSTVGKFRTRDQLAADQGACYSFR